MARERKVLLWSLVRKSKFINITLVFVVLFLACSLAVWLTDDNVTSFGDGLWFSFEVISTIGFGDVLAYSPVARVTTVLLSLYAVFYIAMVTGVVVSFLTEYIRAKNENDIEHFMYELEHLEDLDHDELAALSEKIRRYRRSR